MRSVNDLARHLEPIRAPILEAITSVVDSGWFVLGPWVRRFEAAFAAYCGTTHCVGVANGTEAIEIALRAVGTASGDEVVTVANAGGYGTTAIEAIGATPVYVDIDPDTLIMNPALLPERIGPSTKAILVTHLYGRTAPMEEIMTVARRAGVDVVEDCAQAHGAAINGRKVGSWGALGCFSFYPTKNLGALGDGGAIVGSDDETMSRVRRLRQYGWGDKYRRVLEGGRNSRLDELQAAILLAMLPYLDEWNTRRREIAEAYRLRISHPDVRNPGVLEEGHVAHLYVMLAERREDLRRHLAARNIPSDVHYPTPDYGEAPALAARLPHTERACRTVLTLPCFPEMTEDEVAQVADAVNAWKP